MSDLHDRARAPTPPPDDPPPTLADVYARYATFVYRIARRLGVTESAVEDVMHEVFLVVHRRLPEYDGRATMSTWLYHLTRGVVSNHRRSRAREARRLSLVDPDGRGVPDPEMLTRRQRAADFVRAFIETLDDDQRLVFELAEIDGLSVPEIAEIAGVGINTAYSRLRLARKRFQRAVHELRAGELRGAG